MRTASPAKKASNRLRIPDNTENPGKGPDPEEFVIGDDASDLSRAVTPAPATGDGESQPAELGKMMNAQDVKSPPVKGKEKDSEQSKSEQVPGNDELPQDVRKKLARLEMLTAKYQGAFRTIVSLYGTGVFQ